MSVFARVAGRSLFPVSVFCFLLLASIPRILPAPTDQPLLVRFAVIGDSGTGDKHQYQIAQQMLAWHDRLPYSLTLMLGDNIYGGLFGTGGGEKKDFERKFDRPYGELRARGVTFRAALGNHDMQHRDGQDLIEAYDRFHIDGRQGYYSFTAGHLPTGTPLVEFFVLNTVRLEDDKQDPEQLAWLERALADPHARWRVVYGHHPLYSTGRRHGSAVALREKLEPLLLGSPAETRSRGPTASATGQTPVTPRVQVVLAGHDHLYQRFHPQKGIVHFVCGSSGKLRPGNARRSPLVAAVEDGQHAFMLWEATPDELRFRAINERREAFDCGVIPWADTPKSVSCSALASVR